LKFGVLEARGFELGKREAENGTLHLLEFTDTHYNFRNMFQVFFLSDLGSGFDDGFS
jgi:hypothetical protein